MILRGRAVPLALAGALGLGGMLPIQPVLAGSGVVLPSFRCRTWTIVPAPAVDGYYLNSVSGTSSTDVWAVGGDFSGNTPPLALHWDGAAWTQFSVTDGFLQDVVDISPTDAWAVGPGGYSVYVQHWDGTAWNPVRAPSPGYNYVYGVDAVSSDDVWMVGNYTRSDFTVQPLTEHWDGRAWKIVQAEELTYGGVLYKVSVVSSTDVWAVGYQGTSNAFVFQPLIEHWDGVNWTLASLPILRGVDELFGVAAASASDVWAVGQSIAPDGDAYRPLTMHWDGAAWTPFRAPPRAINGTLLGAWALSSQEVLAVGADTPGDAEPLVDRSHGPC